MHERADGAYARPYGRQAPTGFVTIDVDQARLLPRLRQRVRIAPPAADNASPLELGRLKPDELVLAGASSFDAQRLRGIPAVARGVGGARPGTQPEREALRRLG